MYIPSGEPVIISTTMRKIRSKISLGFLLFLVILGIGFAACFSIYKIFTTTEKDRIIGTFSKDALIEYVQPILDQVVNSESDSFDGFHNGSADALYSFAFLYKGRALICDSQYKILFDTAGYKDSYFINNDIVRCEKGDSVKSLDEQNAMLTYFYPIMSDGICYGTAVFSFSIKEQIENYHLICSHLKVLCLGFLIILCIIDVFICLHVTSPLKAVSKAMLRLSDNSSNESIKVDGYREAVEITDNANHLITRLNEIDESRQEFVSNVSHELKTPMASMKVLADSLLAQEGIPEEMYREFLSDINSEIDRENAIITDLLTLVKMDSKNATLNMQKTHINKLIQVVLNRITPLAGPDNIEVVFENFRDVYAEVDENRLIMAFTNIAQNAVKYNRPGGFIHVSLNSDINYFYVTFEDSGIGIPEDSIPHLFERFYRVDKARSRSTGGNGLGLAITYEVIKAHNGEIKVYSQLNEGTTFAIRIPLSLSVVS